jgi:hemoglobin
MRFAFPARPLATAFILLLALAACTTRQAPNTTAPAGPPLFDRIGGRPVVTAAVEDFFANVGADSRIAGRFANAGSAQFKAELVEQLCVSTGGPCKYTGRPLKDVHASMGISDAEFNAMVQDLRKAMARQNVSVENQVAFAAALEPLRDNVVSSGPAKHTVVAVPAGHAPAAHTPSGRHSVPVKKGAAKKPPAKAKPAAKKLPTTPTS